MPVGPIGVKAPVERRSDATTSAIWRPSASDAPGAAGKAGTAIACAVRTLPPTTSERRLPPANERRWKGQRRGP